MPITEVGQMARFLSLRPVYGTTSEKDLVAAVE